ncbi:hypothetical protein T439DRAFT_314292 [Meredithblackwellia eburnea MCA 4105]
MRPMFVVNGQAEGPLIEANQGDTMQIRVTNNLDTGVAIHWHGMAQNRTGWADGPNGITQCPIPAGQSFTYVFELDRPDQYGTYWWHAHRGAMYADGLTGPFIIHSPNDPLKLGVDYDLDQIMFLRDNFHAMSTDIVDGLLSLAGFDGTPIAPSPKSGLINGEGVYNCTFAPAGSSCVQKSVPEYVFPPGKKIRLRLINGGSHAMFRVSVDNHMLEVIEADDTPVSGPLVHRVPIFSAQRYSVILDTTGDKQNDAYYFRAQINTDCFAAPFTDLDPDVKAIIRISKPKKTPKQKAVTSIDWADALGGICQDLDDANLVPRIAIDAPSEVGITGQWDAAFNFTQIGVFEWTLNGQTLENYMYDPMLFQVYRGETIDPHKVTNFVVPGIQTSDLIINNLLGADHPFHMHAMQFWVVARGNGTLQASDVGSVNFNTVNPIRRDVTTIPAGQYAVLRFISDIPGVHAFHCHIAWHQAAGLFGVIVAQPENVPDLDIPDSAFALCDPSNYEGTLGLLTLDPGRKKRSVVDTTPILPPSKLVRNKKRNTSAHASPKGWERKMAKKAYVGHRHGSH